MTNVQVGRLDNNRMVVVNEGTSVESALREAGYQRGDNEVIQDISGNEYQGNEAVVEGKGYFFVQRVKSGN